MLSRSCGPILRGKVLVVVSRIIAPVCVYLCRVGSACWKATDGGQISSSLAYRRHGSGGVRSVRIFIDASHIFSILAYRLWIDRLQRCCRCVIKIVVPVRCRRIWELRIVLLLGRLTSLACLAGLTASYRRQSKSVGAS
jgi:hypothetical protein